MELMSFPKAEKASTVSFSVEEVEIGLEFEVGTELPPSNSWAEDFFTLVAAVGRIIAGIIMILDRNVFRVMFAELYCDLPGAVHAWTCFFATTSKASRTTYAREIEVVNFIVWGYT